MEGKKSSMYLFSRAKKPIYYFFLRRFWPKLGYGLISKTFPNKGKGTNNSWLEPIRIYTQERETVFFPSELSNSNIMCILQAKKMGEMTFDQASSMLSSWSDLKFPWRQPGNMSPNPSNYTSQWNRKFTSKNIS